IVLAVGLGVVERFALPGLSWAWPAAAGACFTVLFVVWMTNLYNFMDGADGLAGGMTVFGFITFAVLADIAEQPTFAMLSMAVAASPAGFLVFNLPPARIFMGDVGATTLGFVVAGFALWADRDGIFPLW